MTTARSLTTSDGESLVAEFALAAGAERAAMVLCHPHPQYGGTMRSIVISALFEALPAAGVTCLRFNYRGVAGSTGTHDGGRAERVDALAAVHALVEVVGTDLPLILTGWSFGADVALSVADAPIAAWLAIAPPLRFATDLAPVAGDARPKHLALAEHDEFRPPHEVADAVAAWTATTTEVVGGASHFFIGRTERLVTIAGAFVSEVAARR
ncbi:MAG: hypothetical protein MUP67_12655 [Acidimicrobiia bacterium]|nr:hypothetical protein [Acidimicrobiia bacterium]